MAAHSIEAYSFDITWPCVNFPGAHDFLVLRCSDTGDEVAELHGSWQLLRLFKTVYSPNGIQHGGHFFESVLDLASINLSLSTCS
jgi:hypothetical protein